MLKFICVVSVLACATSSVYAHEWTQISGGLKNIAASVNHIWGVNAGDAIYRCAQPCKGNWVNVPGGLRQVDTNDYEVWGTTSGNAIYKRSIDGSGSWVRVSGAAFHVSASGNGYIWAIGIDYCSYSCKKPCSGGWTRMDTCALKQLDAGEEYVYAVNQSNHVLSRPVDGSGSWRVVPGLMQYVSVGPHEIYGIDPQNEIHRCRKPCIGEWEKITFDDGDLKQMDATINGIFAVTTGSTIYHYKKAY